MFPGTIESESSRKVKFTLEDVADYSVIFQKPMFEIKVLQMVRGHSLGFDWGILVLKCSNELLYLSSKRTRSHLIISIPNCFYSQYMKLPFSTKIICRFFD